MSSQRTSPATAARAPSRWLRLAQAGWAVAALLALGIYAASLVAIVLGFGGSPFSRRVIAAPAGPVQTVIQAVLLVVGLVTFPIMFSAAPLCLGLAGLLVWRKPRDRMVLFVSFYLLLYGIVWVGPLDGLGLLLTGARADTLLTATRLPMLNSSTQALHALAFWWATLVLLTLFPSGRFVPAWTRWLALLATLTAPLLVAIDVQWFQRHPTPLPFWSTLLYTALTFAAAGYAQVSRYRHVSTPTERQQTKWVVAGLVVWVVLLQVELVLFTILFNWPLHAALPWWTLGFGLLHGVEVIVLPLTLTVAVLHYRVFDIDVLIRRTLVYASLTAILGVVYAAGVLGAQAVVQALTGQRGQQPVLIVASTLLVAALFTPVRRRLQAGIDERFYRHKYVAAQTLAAFGATLRTAMDLEQLSDQLQDVVQETMQPAHVSLWLRPPFDRSPSAPSQPGTPVSV